MKIFCRNSLAPLLALVWLLPALPGLAQTNRNGKPLEPPAAQSAKAQSELPVLLSVTVRNKKHGDLIPGLTQGDFKLAVDHKPLATRIFEPAGSLPLTLGLLVDTSGAEHTALGDERAAAGRFLDHLLSVPNQRAFVIQFAHEVDLLADVSTNKNTLHSALGQLGKPQSRNTAADQGNSGERHFHVGGGDNLYDAIYLASDNLMKHQPDRKVLVVLTNGIDSGSRESLFSAIEAAQRSNSIVYAVYFEGEKQRGSHSSFPRRRGGLGFPGGGYPGGGYPGGGYPGGRGGGWPGGNAPQTTGRPTEGSRTNGRKILEQICSETGGRLFEVGRKMTFDQALGAIAGELSAQYIVGFIPAKGDSYSGYHRIDLTVDRKNAVVQTRQGFYVGDK
ncbi:MAG TPA: VWA domain-containing protein [Acidobacteriaceae bacterium]|nr:VWA domain-containing protein [Acidobacteriaceae bacterium]